MDPTHSLTMPIYLRDYPNAAGGVTLIFKYTGRSPTVPNPNTNSPAVAFIIPRLRKPSPEDPRSQITPIDHCGPPLAATRRVEALFQGATKNMMERGERSSASTKQFDAVGEIRRNMQGLQEARSPGRGEVHPFGESRPTFSIRFAIYTGSDGSGEIVDSPRCSTNPSTTLSAWRPREWKG